ncbi:MAG: hypothetical protein LBH92_02180 [Bacteroidales bacterium]|nr:hypothetical protein [Bacteroidales bacterium]
MKFDEVDGKIFKTSAVKLWRTCKPSASKSCLSGSAAALPQIATFMKMTVPFGSSENPLYLVYFASLTLNKEGSLTLPCFIVVYSQ